MTEVPFHLTRLGRVFYEPGDWGFEAKVRQRLQDIEDRRDRDRGGDG